MRPNPQRSGVCVACQEESDRLFDAPLLRVSFADLGIDSILTGVLVGGLVLWHAPKTAYPGREAFEVVEVLDDAAIMRPPETDAGLHCWECWVGRMWPQLHPYLENWPPQIILVGWKAPKWSSAVDNPTIRGIG